MKGRLRIVVAGTFSDVAGQAGASWSVMQYVQGLRDLGHDVWLLEQVGSLNGLTRRRFRRACAEFGLAGSAGLIGADPHLSAGLPPRDIASLCGSADLLINLSGVLRRPDLLDRFRTRVYLDLDPAFNQLWHHSGIDRGFGEHTHHFTVGLGLGDRPSRVPTCGYRWQPTLPPVVLKSWPEYSRAPAGPITTVGNWRSYGSIEAEGTFYGQKAHSIRPLAPLAARSGEDLVLALAIDAGDRADEQILRTAGWTLVDPRRVAGTSTAYRRFIGSSKAELGFAKAGYVTAACGWFSDRSACYLASGRPVIAQDTGLAGHLPLGEGLLTFRSAQDALGAIEQLNASYDRHARAARQLAETLLDARLVLPRLLDRVSAG